MSWVKYSKNSLKHKACQKVKRDLTKLVKKYEQSDNNFFIELTGRENVDKDRLRSCERLTYGKLASDISKSIKENDELGYDGFYIRSHLKTLEFIKDLYEVQKFIQRNYYLCETKTVSI